MDERRFVVSNVSDRHQGDRAYFAALNAELDNGGVEAMLHDLLAMDLQGWHPREVIETQALNEQIEASLPLADEWLLECLETGELPRSKTWPFTNEPGFVTNDALTKGLADYCKGKGRPPKGKARAALLRSAGADQGKSNKDERGWRFPALAEARAEWVKNNYPRTWESVDDWG